MVWPAFHFSSTRHLRLCQVGLDACQKRGVSPALLGISEKALRGALTIERVPLPCPPCWSRPSHLPHPHATAIVRLGKPRAGLWTSILGVWGT